MNRRTNLCGVHALGEPATNHHADTGTGNFHAKGHYQPHSSREQASACDRENSGPEHRRELPCARLYDVRHNALLGY